jgi:hypothetical protein
MRRRPFLSLSLIIGTTGLVAGPGKPRFPGTVNRVEFECVATPFLQELFGYDDYDAGLILSPAEFFTMVMMPVVGFLLGKKVDARYIIPFGLLCLAGGPYWHDHLKFY